MDGLPSLLVDEILFKIDLKSLAKMRCTNKSFHSRLSDPYFKSEYYSRVGSSLLHMTRYGSKMICFLPFFKSTSPRKPETQKLEFQILGSRCGLLLLFCRGLCVANPFTKKFRFLDHTTSNLFPRATLGKVVDWDSKVCIGFAVDQIGRTSQRFKVVCIKDYESTISDKTMYQFEITAGDSWRLSSTTITCHSSDLYKPTNAVYVNESLHWLRNDESILAFNPETEEARLIQIKFPQEAPISKTLFAADDSKLTLICPTKEVTYVYALEDILTDPKWVLARRIENVVVDEKRLLSWDVVAYDGKCLFLREYTSTLSEEDFLLRDCKWEWPKKCLVHRYDMRANKWGVIGSIPNWCCISRDFYLLTPSDSCVIGLDEREMKLKPCDNERISSLRLIMGSIDRTSSEAI